MACQWGDSVYFHSPPQQAKVLWSWEKSQKQWRIRTARNLKLLALREQQTITTPLEANKSFSEQRSKRVERREKGKDLRQRQSLYFVLFLFRVEVYKIHSCDVNLELLEGKLEKFQCRLDIWQSKWQPGYFQEYFKNFINKSKMLTLTRLNCFKWCFRVSYDIRQHLTPTLETWKWLALRDQLGGSAQEIQMFLERIIIYFQRNCLEVNGIVEREKLQIFACSGWCNNNNWGTQEEG